MQRSRPVALLACLILVVSAVVVPMSVGSAGSGTDSSAVGMPSPSDNTTARLTLHNSRITGDEFETVRLGMGSTLQSGADGVRLEHERLTVKREFEAADSLDRKRNVIDRALIDLNTRASNLETRERDAIASYSDGEVTAGTLVRELARIDASARKIQTSLDLLRSLADRNGIDRFESRTVDVEGYAETLTGPIRHRAARAMATDAPPTRIYIVGSDEGVVLSMLTDDRYLREATQWANRNTNGDPELDFGRVGARAGELYPWVASENAADGFIGRGRGVWRFDASHPQGELTAYLDAASSDVFREVQTFTVTDMPTTMTLVRSGNGVRVTLYRTYDGGPLNVLVENAATGAVTNARVTVDGYDLGNTGADGLVRTIEPRTPYTVNVTGDDANFTFTVERPFDESEG